MKSEEITAAVAFRACVLARKKLVAEGRKSPSIAQVAALAPSLASVAKAELEGVRE